MVNSAEVTRIRGIDYSISKFPQEVILTCPLPSREYAIEASSSGSISLNKLEGTPRSILSRFRAERNNIGLLPPTPETPTLRRVLPEHTGLNTPLSSEDIELDSGFSPQPAEREEEESGITEDELDILPKSRKRPFIEDKNNIQAPSSPSLRSSKHRRLLPFFGTKELRAAERMFALDSSSDEVTLDPSPIPVGERLYVQHLMRKLLFKPDQITFQHGKHTQRTVWKTHDASLIKKHEPHQALVFDEELNTGKVKVFKGNVDALGIPEKSSAKSKLNESRRSTFELGGRDGDDDWSYLEKWNRMPDDKLLPAFGD